MVPFFAWNVFQMKGKNQVLLEYIPNKSKKIDYQRFETKTINLF